MKLKYLILGVRFFAQIVPHPEHTGVRIDHKVFVGYSTSHDFVSYLCATKKYNRTTMKIKNF